MLTPQEVVQQWHEALNRGDIEGMVTYVHDDVEIAGPRGTTRGVQTMRAWFGRANVRLVPQAYFVNGEPSGSATVVVTAEGEWFDANTGTLQDSQLVANIFRIVDARIRGMIRCDLC